MKQLTNAEEAVMHILWKLKKGFVKEIIEEMPEPKPAYNTTSTIVRILEKKKALGCRKQGKSHIYIPLLGQEEYQLKGLDHLVGNIFSGEKTLVLKTLIDSKGITLEDLKELKEIISKRLDE